MAESAAGAEEVVFLLFFLLFRRRRDILQFLFHLCRLFSAAPWWSFPLIISLLAAVFFVLAKEKTNLIRSGEKETKTNFPKIFLG